jgi:hypothetical protein
LLVNAPLRVRHARAKMPKEPILRGDGLAVP